MQLLVVYGSTRGGTAGLAHMVADACAMQGISADVRRAGDVRDLGDADAVIVGGALYNNRWHPEAVVFVGRHRAALQQLPVWFFSSGPLDTSARSGALAPVPQVNTLAREVEIRGHMTFGGLLDRRPNGLFGMFAYGTEGDFRDRRHVAEWVERIATELRADTPVTVRVIGPTATKPTVVVKPFEPEPPEPTTPPEAPEVKAGTAYDDIVLAPPSIEVTDSAGSKRSRLRRYFTLDRVGEDDDDGLDLFDETAEAEEREELVGVDEV